MTNYNFQDSNHIYSITVGLVKMVYSLTIKINPLYEVNLEIGSACLSPVLLGEFVLLV